MTREFHIAVSGALWIVIVVCGLAAANATAQVCSPMPPDLIAWYRAEGNQDDSSGHDLNGRLPFAGSTPPGYAPVMVGQGFVFNGSNSGIAVDPTPMLQPEHVTVMAWARPECSPIGNDAHGPVIATYDNPGAYSYILAGPGLFGGVRFKVMLDDMTECEAATGPIPLGNTIHLAGTWDGSTSRLYVNGVLAAATTAGPKQIRYAANPDGLGIGRHHNGGADFAARPFCGKLDEVAVFARDLSQLEIQRIVAAGSAGFCDGPPPPCSPAPQGMIGWWPGEGNANDASGNSHDGTLGYPPNDNHPGSTAPWFEPVVVGQGFVFNGQNSGVAIPPSPALEPALVSVVAWIAPTCSPIGADVHGPVIASYDNAGAYSYLIAGPGTTGLVRFKVFLTDMTEAEAVSPGPIALGSVHLIAGTWDGSTSRLYLDGNLIASNPVGPKTIRYLDSHGLGIGRHHNGGVDFTARPFCGAIDEVAVFDRPLAIEEIQAIFAAGAAGMCRNSAPIPCPGADQTVYENTPVTLDGNCSHDPEGTPLSFAWTQESGPPVTLIGATSATPTFTAPAVPAGGATLTFLLTVSDGVLTSAPAITNVTVKNSNNRPIAEAGDPQTVNEGSVVTLHGENSFDPDGEPLSWSWQQTGGIPVALVPGPDVAQPSFTAPASGPAGESLTFSLTVSDGIDVSLADSVTVNVVNVNQPPVADAGLDQTADEATTVTLSGLGSHDPDCDPLTYDWLQTDGAAVTISDPSAPTITFTTPVIQGGAQTLTFRLRVSDGLLASSADVHVTVRDSIAAPVCSNARPSVDVLWPANHKMTSISIVGVADAEGRPVTIAILSVSQDEPVSGLGGGDTSPDAKIVGDSALLRAERDPSGNGRVYVVHFLATDELGQTCTGSVKVVVPKTKKSGDIAIDDGQIYDSTQG